MSEIRVNNLSNESNTGGPTITGITTFSGTNFFVPPVGNTAQRPDNPQKGAIRFNTDTKHLEYYKGDTIGWSEVEASHNQLGGGTGSNTGTGHRGLYGSGQKAPSAGTYAKEIDFLTISTLGNAQDFGDLAEFRSGRGLLSSTTRAVFGAGYGPADDMEYVTMASTGDALSFGTELGNRNGQAGLSDGVRGVFGGGGSPTLDNNVISYITIATTANSVTFGDLTVGGRNQIAACASSTRGLFAGGGSSDVEYNTIDYITIATTGNAVNFGDLAEHGTNDTNAIAGGSNSTRAIWWGGADTPGYNNVNVIAYSTIATLGNSIDFGDTSVTTSGGSACPDPTRLIMKLGSAGNGVTTTNNIEYIQIATTGNAVDFGDLLAVRANPAAASNAHGGL